MLLLPWLEQGLGFRTEARSTWDRSPPKKGPCVVSRKVGKVIGWQAVTRWTAPTPDFGPPCWETMLRSKVWRSSTALCTQSSGRRPNEQKEPSLALSGKISICAALGVEASKQASKLQQFFPEGCRSTAHTSMFSGSSPKLAQASTYPGVWWSTWHLGSHRLDQGRGYGHPTCQSQFLFLRIITDVIIIAVMILITARLKS